MKNQTVIIGVVILVVILAAFFFIGRRKTSAADTGAQVDVPNILPSIGGSDMGFQSVGDWINKRSKEGWAFNTKLI